MCKIDPESLHSLIDIIYPPQCYICGKFLKKEEKEHFFHGLCTACLKRLKPLEKPICSICGVPFDSPKDRDHLCKECLSQRPWYDRARSAYYYSEPLAGAIQDLKYRSSSKMVPVLGNLLWLYFKEWTKQQKAKDPLIVPVPLHRKKLKERGYNQSLLLARKVASCSGLHLNYKSLAREKNTTTQTGLKKEERRRNVKGAFSLKKPEAVRDRNIILVDDVFTTGQTLNECTKTLKRAGAASVSCITLARTTESFVYY